MLHFAFHFSLSERIRKRAHLQEEGLPPFDVPLPSHVEVLHVSCLSLFLRAGGTDVANSEDDFLQITEFVKEPSTYSCTYHIHVYVHKDYVNCDVYVYIYTERRERETETEKTQKKHKTTKEFPKRHLPEANLWVLRSFRRIPYRRV